MELAANKTACNTHTPCADCCSDCAVYDATACCTTACCGPCCDTNCELLNAAPMEISYQYEEPEENFVSIDDAKIKGLLLKIGQEQQAAEAKRRQQQPVIELLDDEDDDEQLQPMEQCLPQAHDKTPTLIISTARSLATTTVTQRQSPDIQLIPKINENMSHRIVAQIELLDSDSEEELEPKQQPNPNAQITEDDEELPFAAAAAVSCELLDDEEEQQLMEEDNSEQIIVLQSDDELENYRPVAKTTGAASRSYVKRRGRHLYQCLACGKKVQSNYNLRRHMMIHTGERPFACDMCERRFREFSDLKKHRRRHANDANFICMICRLRPPTEQDSTRCTHCEGINLLIKPQSSCDEVGEDDDESDTALTATVIPTVTPTVTAAAITKPPKTQPSKAAVPKPTPAPQQTLRVTLTPTAAPPSTAAPVPPRSCSSASSASNDATPAKSNIRARREYPCPLCQRPFGTRHNLKRHFMIHTGEKPFSCSKCRKPFRECSTLKKHMITHMRDRWYKCLRCPQKFQDYLDYTAHKNTHLSETGSGVAANTRKQQSELVYDSGAESFDDCDDSVEAWLECCECNRRFTDLDAYTVHLKNHEQELFGTGLDDEDQDVDVA